MSKTCERCKKESENLIVYWWGRRSEFQSYKYGIISKNKIRLCPHCLQHIELGINNFINREKNS